MTETTKFGIEIECFIDNAARATFDPGRYHRGTSIRLPGLTGWNSQQDSSLRNSRNTHFAAEVVSPVLEGEQGLAETYYTCENLQNVDAKTNSSCGLHVHIDATDLTPEQVQNVKKSFRRYEMAFYALAGNDIIERLRSSYCSPSPSWTGDRNRYQSLNLSNVGNPRKNTIEIRCFAGTVDPWLACVAAFMAVALVSRAKDANAPYSTRIQDPVDAAETFCKHYIKSEYMIVEGTEEELQDIKDTIMEQAQKAKSALEAQARQHSIGI